MFSILARKNVIINNHQIFLKIFGYIRNIIYWVFWQQLLSYYFYTEIIKIMIFKSYYLKIYKSNEQPRNILGIKEKSHLRLKFYQKQSTQRWSKTDSAYVHQHLYLHIWKLSQLRSYIHKTKKPHFNICSKNIIYTSLLQVPAMSLENNSSGLTKQLTTFSRMRTTFQYIKNSQTSLSY